MTRTTGHPVATATVVSPAGRIGRPASGAVDALLARAPTLTPPLLLLTGP